MSLYVRENTKNLQAPEKNEEARKHGWFQ